MSTKTINTIDALLADLNDAIFELKEGEQLNTTYQSNVLTKENNPNLKILIPIVPPVRGASNIPPPSYDTISNNLSSSNILQNNEENIVYFEAPKDTKLSSISSLPDAFGGWLQKVSYKAIIKTRQLKKKYLILANCTLYIFNDDHKDEEFDDALPINKKSVCRVSEKGIFVLEFMTEYRETIADDGLGGVLEMNGLGSVKQKKQLEFQCSDRDEMMVWLDCFKEVIQEAKNGRVPLGFEKNQKPKQQMQQLAISSPAYKDSSSVEYDYRSTPSPSPLNLVSSYRDSDSTFSNTNLNRSTINSTNSNNSQERHLPPVPAFIDEYLNPASPIPSRSSTVKSNTSSHKSGENMFAQTHQLSLKEEKEKQKRLKKEKKEQKAQEQMKFFASEFL
ncbi:hypothetical protein HK099_001221 [Clydaea vesicula]|uniref:PH domain-containing protein n=1 Tax=Clydaea vesicula TaxID=447962 RepID=A0AAD5XX73_9FUNG|nr:hypothetical protein HK099_001221 [Clydaea vesicula]